MFLFLFRISAPDPSYGFEKKLDKKKHGKTKRKLKLRCKTDDPNAKVKWFKNGKEIKPSDTAFLMKQDNGECSLEIKEAELEDSGTYTCRIDEFGKEGENETSCDVHIGGKLIQVLKAIFSAFSSQLLLTFLEFPHKFASELKGMECVEDDHCKFEIEVDEDDAEVTWFKDGVEIIPDGKRLVSHPLHFFFFLFRRVRLLPCLCPRLMRTTCSFNFSRKRKDSIMRQKNFVGINLSNFL